MKDIYKRGISGLVYVVVLWSFTSYSETTFVFLFFVMGLISLNEMWKLRKGKSKLIALLYVIIPFCIVQLFGFSDHNYPTSNFDPSPILIMFILTWVFDTFAYLTGSKFGKNKILPKISPKKTWEGFAGGLLFSVISVYFIRIYFDYFPLYLLLIFSIVIPFTASAGDFIESYYKRMANVKDSGKFIPGHGGMLDRMDAFMITIPTLYILMNLLNENL